ncbi:hypothetical protein ACLKA7_001123 [Drosophila subpalustris]
MASRGDFNLLTFDSYSDYLKSFTKTEEYRYLGGMKVIKTFVKLGYRTNATIYDEAEFHKIRKRLLELINPKSTRSQLFSRYLVGDDPALVAFAEREERNVQKKLSTIIFLQIRRRNGFDISGYIDYADSLQKCTTRSLGATNWKAVFEGRILLKPNRNHLSFYDWHSGIVCFNNSNNYEVVNYGASLCFKHIGDHKIVPVTTADSSFKDNVKRQLIQSPMYGCVAIYDHIVRKSP